MTVYCILRTEYCIQLYLESECSAEIHSLHVVLSLRGEPAVQTQIGGLFAQNFRIEKSVLFNIYIYIYIYIYF
jgi:hypothetical protein